MKKNTIWGKFLVVATAGVMALSLIAGGITSFAGSGRVDFVGEAKAKQIALNNSGLKESEVTFVKTTLELENGNYEYEVEFYKGVVEHDYKIDAKTGRILEYDKDIENFNIPVNTANNGNTVNTTNTIKTENKGTLNNQTITAEKAKEIALKHAGLKFEEVKFIKVELDKERGFTVYDVEFYKGNIEYDFEIDAKTGKVREFDKDIENFVIKNITNANADNAGITLEQAKKIALKHVGLSENQVSFIKAKMDKDNGKSIYDIEFYADNTEYDFEIDAKTGKILDYDYDSYDDSDDRDFDRDDDADELDD